MSSGLVRFGVIGLRRGQSFLRICRAVGGADVAAVYDVDPAVAAVAANDLGVPGFTVLEEFLDAGLDAVVVASPVPYHAEQVATCLSAGVHVLSEVIACTTVQEARQMVQVQRANPGSLYMLAENYCYFDEVELVRRLAAEGRFGDIHYAEGEYLHDCRSLWYQPDGSLAWRATTRMAYCTHSLGPLLSITDDSVRSVTAMTVPGGVFDPEVRVASQILMTMATHAGRVFRVRVDHTSPRPHVMDYYSIQGTRGAYEAGRGNGDTSKIWLEDLHGESNASPGAQWHDLGEFAGSHLQDRLNAPPNADVGGHGTSEYWMLTDFLAAVRGERPVPIDLHRGLDFTLPGIIALESAEAGGSQLAVPDSRAF